MREGPVIVVDAGLLAVLQVVAENQVLVAQVQPPVGDDRVRPDAAAGGAHLRLLRNLQRAALLPPLGRRLDQLALAEFLASFVGFYDLAVQEYPERCSNVEIIPGRKLAFTPAEEQVRWLENEIARGHRKRLGRIGLECVL